MVFWCFGILVVEPTNLPFTPYSVVKNFPKSCGVVLFGIVFRRNQNNHLILFHLRWGKLLAAKV